jgi:hypothetical protein
MNAPAYQFEDVLPEVFEGPVRYPYWKLYLPSNQVTAECVGEGRPGPNARRGASPEARGAGEDGFSAEGSTEALGTGTVDPDTSRAYLTQVLGRLQPGRYTLICWASPGGHRGARALPFFKNTAPVQGLAPLAGSGLGGVDGSGISALIEQVSSLQRENQQLHIEAAERLRRQETEQMQAQIKALEAKLSSDTRWIEPIGKLLIARLVPAAAPLLSEASAPAPVAGASDRGAQQEVDLSAEQIEELNQVMTRLVQRGGAQVLTQLKAINGLDDAAFLTVINAPV